MQIYSIFVLYYNIQIYLELNHCTIIYGERYCLFVCVVFLVFVNDFLAANVGSDVIFAEK